MAPVVHTLTKAIIILSILTCLISCSSPSIVEHQRFQQPTKTILITNINILSEDGLQMIERQNVLIDDGVILEISTNSIDIEPDLAIDGKDQFLIPGLIDSHVHLQQTENDLLVYLAYGVTYVREMSGTDKHLQWQNELENGRVGPSIEVSSEKISSKSGLWGIINEMFWTRINISSAQEAMQLVQELKNKGFTNAKISSDISKEMYFEITDVARNEKLRVAGHIPYSVNFDEFITRGHAEIAHIEELVKTINREFGYFTSATSDDFLLFVEQRAQEMAAALSAKNIAVGTTLWYMQSIPQQVDNLPTLIDEVDLSFTNPKRVLEWLPSQNDFALNHQHLSDWWSTFAKANEIVLKALVDQEVTILAGTDAMTTMVVPGLSIHQELESLVDAGMTNAQAIESATNNPAKWMDKKVGKVSVGYDADLLILNSNPLNDISATGDINWVIKNGRPYNKSTLANMLNNVRSVYAN